ncbi:MAG: hypothetical protein V4620_00110 [Bacteroidota bacterium]
MKTLHLPILLLLTLCYQSCGKETDGCPESTNDFYNLTDAEKSKVPYTGSDTLVFISNEGDTATLVGQGKKQTYKNITVSLGNPNCGGTHSENYDRIEYNFTSNNTKLNPINIIVYRATDPNSYVVYYDFAINGINKFQQTSKFIYNEMNYLDSIKINEIYVPYINIRSYTNPSNKIYYSKDKGIIQIDLDTLTYKKS